jgi:two-component system phosphate regulon sensor histidine kinase PhoR
LKKRKFNIIIALGSLVLIILIVSQFVWIKKQLELEDQNFEQKVKAALGNVGNQLQFINKEAIDAVYPVSRISKDQFVVTINDLVQPKLLDSLIAYEFRDYEIDLPYSYGIYDCQSDSVSFNHRVLPAGEFTISSWDPSTHNFGIIFPTLSSFFQNLGVWMISSLIVLVVVFMFSYFVYIILQQRQVDEIKTDFVNNMTHELKTPISTISLSSEALLKPNNLENPERITRYSEIIKDEAIKLKTLVEKVLQVALYNEGGEKLEKEKHNFISIINQVIDKNELRFLDKKVELVWNRNQEECVINIDKIHISNVIDNLIDNAIKYSTNKIVIHLELKSDANSLTFSIQDNGIGVSKENQKHVFDKFYRVPTGNLHSVKGFGIGLNYSATIVKQHEGKISISSTLNEGSIFSITLPK